MLRVMKDVFLALIGLFLLGTFAQAQDVTPEMKKGFLDKVKAIVAE